MIYVHWFFNFVMAFGAGRLLGSCNTDKDAMSIGYGLALLTISYAIKTGAEMVCEAVQKKK